jgi:hypothetical protein
MWHEHSAATPVSAYPWKCSLWIVPILILYPVLSVLCTWVRLSSKHANLMLTRGESAGWKMWCWIAYGSSRLHETCKARSGVCFCPFPPRVKAAPFERSATPFGNRKDCNGLQQRPVIYQRQAGRPCFSSPQPPPSSCGRWLNFPNPIASA